MTYLIILAATLLPVIALLCYIYKSDPISEPLPMLKKAFLYGVMICLPASLAEMFLSYGVFGIGDQPTSFLGAAVESFFVAALAEESLKLTALWLILRNNPYFDEHFDGIVYAVFVSLGFAAIENVMYLFSNSGDWLSVGIGRALLAVPGHYAFGVIMGYYYSMYCFVKRSSYNRMMILVAPIIAHGIYDTIAFSASLTAELASALMFALCIFCYFLQKNARRKLAEHVKRDTDPFHFWMNDER